MFVIQIQVLEYPKEAIFRFFIPKETDTHHLYKQSQCRIFVTHFHAMLVVESDSKKSGLLGLFPCSFPFEVSVLY